MDAPCVEYVVSIGCSIWRVTRGDVGNAIDGDCVKDDIVRARCLEKSLKPADYRLKS